MRTTRHRHTAIPLLVVLLLFAATRDHAVLTENVTSKPPCRADDVVVFYTAKAPPLTCIIDSDCDQPNGTTADFRLGARLLSGSPYQLTSYQCKFEESDNSNSSALFRDSIPEFTTVFEPPYLVKEEHIRLFIGSSLLCLFDSDLPDDFFHVIVKRPHEEAPYKCRVRDLDSNIYVRFPGYPTIICEYERRSGFSPSTYRFKLQEIMRNRYSCAFLVYDEVKLDDMGTEQLLHQRLTRGFPKGKGSGWPRFRCSGREVSTDKEPGFQLRMSTTDLYNCHFLDPNEDTTEPTVKRFFGW